MGMQSMQIPLKGYTFEVQVDAAGIKFFEIARIPARDHAGKILQTHISLGSVSCSVNKDTLMISSGSVTIDPKRFADAAKKDPKFFARLSEQDVLGLEEKMLRTAGKMIFERHKGITRVSGGLFDMRSKSFLEGNNLFAILRGDLPLRNALARQLIQGRRAAQRVQKPISKKPKRKRQPPRRPR